MPYCPLCRAELHEQEVCPSCECALADELPAEHTDDSAILPRPPLELLVRCDHLAVAAVESALEKRSIPCLIEPIQAFTFAPQVFVRVYVSRSQAHPASAALEELRREFPRMKLDYTGGFSEAPPMPGA